MEGEGVDAREQAEVIAFLAHPATWGVTGPVERIDTHAAIIFLAGDEAWKMKRAVRYPYLDFSTPERRRAVCEEELRINRRTAPDLYIDVSFVGRRANGTLAVNEGEPVDWLVHMRRFAPGSLLDTMAHEAPLAPALVRELADAIAAFHEGAQVMAGPGAARVRAVIEGNRESMAALPADLLPAERRETLFARSMDRLAALAPLLDRRAGEGCVRHCHGDLHLANICLWQGRPTLFDALEFDAALAETDVLYDLAFLVMDLVQRGLDDGASLLLNRYCDRRSEADGLAAMGLFLSMRAAVRAHVEASAALTQTDADHRAAKVQASRSYLAAAFSFLEPQAPRLVAVGGLSGTGKSTLAGRLAARIAPAPGARWLRTDVLRKRFAGLAPEDRLPASAYTPAAGQAVYAALFDEAKRVLATGTSVIVDGVFADPDERAAVTAIAAAARVPLSGLWLEAPPDVLRARVSARTGDASDADIAVVNRQLGYELGDLAPWHVIDASGTMDDTLKRAMDRLG